MEVEQWKLADIKPHSGNPRQNDAAVDAVATSSCQTSLRCFGSSDDGAARMSTPRRSAGRDDYVYVPAVRCPACGSFKHKTYKSGKLENDGSRRRYTKCLEPGCLHKFVVVVERYQEVEDGKPDLIG